MSNQERRLSESHISWALGSPPAAADDVVETMIRPKGQLSCWVFRRRTLRECPKRLGDSQTDGVHCPGREHPLAEREASSSVRDIPGRRSRPDSKRGAAPQLTFLYRTTSSQLPIAPRSCRRICRWRSPPCASTPPVFCLPFCTELKGLDRRAWAMALASRSGNGKQNPPAVDRGLGGLTTSLRPLHTAILSLYKVGTYQAQQHSLVPKLVPQVYTPTAGAALSRGN